MSEKKHHKHQPEDAYEAKAEGATDVPESELRQPAQPITPELEDLKHRLAESEAKVAEYLDGWQRTQAEFANYKKRLERDNETTYVLMKGDVIRKFLPVLDDLERALKSKPRDENAEAWAGGIELIIRKMQAILEAEGVKRIEAEGTAFDPNLHEAISHEPSDGMQSGHVIAVVQNGYTLGERVIRPAQVRVAQ